MHLLHFCQLADLSLKRNNATVKLAELVHKAIRPSFDCLAGDERLAFSYAGRLVSRPALLPLDRQGLLPLLSCSGGFDDVVVHGIDLPEIDHVMLPTAAPNEVGLDLPFCKDGLQLWEGQHQAI